MDILRTSPTRWGAALWLGMNGLAPALCLWTAGPTRVALAGPGDLWAAQACAALFFLLFLWPLLIPSTVRAGASCPDRQPGAPAGGSTAPTACPVRILAVQLAAFAVLGSPLACLSVRLAAAEAAEALRSGAVLASAAACVTAVFAGERWNHPRIPVLYQAAAWAVSAAAPFAYYLGREWAGADWTWLAALSPFRGVANPGAATPWGPLWAIHAASYALIAVLLSGVTAVGKKRKP